MAEINTLPWNGFKVVSTFSGCGGSCLGYRMAGFRVIWANEFLPAAQVNYKANSNSFLDFRDIRNVKPEEILQVTGLKTGELDLFDGSPPCQAFSTAGKRAKGWGKAKTYENGISQCNETLFSEYVRLLRGLLPKVFVAENVSGLVKGVAKGYFLEILRDLKASGYRVKCKVLDAQWLGVPQQRQRVIFIGVREDLRREPVFPKPLPYRYSVREALPWVGKVLHDTGGQNPNRWAGPCPAITNGLVGHSGYKKILRSFDGPCQTIQKSGPSEHLSGILMHQAEKREFTIPELKRICAFPDDFILQGSYAQQWAVLGNSVPPVMMYCVAKTIRDEILLK